MKKIILLQSLLFSLTTFAVSGSDLLNARDAALDEASFELDLDTITAFSITPSANNNVEVAFKDETETHHYECHYHGTDMACHEEGDHHKSNKNGHGEFEHLEEGHMAGLLKLEKTLRRKGADLNVLKSIKAWKLEESHSTGDGHDHGDDVWTKVNYDLNNKNFTVYIQCHVHEEKGEEEEFACHYKREGKGEPTL
jgi:hypothetical protein